MRRPPPWLVSIAAHVAVVALWLALRPGHEPRRPHETTVEIIDRAPEPPPVITPPPASDDGDGGGGQPVAMQARRTEPAKVRTRPRSRPRPEPARIAQPAPAPAPAPATTEPAAESASDEAELHAETASTTAPTGEGGTGGGTGGGDGAGHGTGTGVGDGAAKTPPPVHAFDQVVAAPRSKARPARLIYPRSDHEERAEVLFVAVLTVDTDGVVVGARLQHAPSGSAAVDRAMSGVFRFVYDPARDDAGRPVTSKVTQRFMAQ